MAIQGIKSQDEPGKSPGKPGNQLISGVFRDEVYPEPSLAQDTGKLSDTLFCKGIWKVARAAPKSSGNIPPKAFYATRWHKATYEKPTLEIEG